MEIVLICSVPLLLKLYIEMGDRSFDLFTLFEYFMQ